MDVLTLLFERLSLWYSEYCNQINQELEYITFGERDENFLDLANYVLKKNWICIESITKVGSESPKIECFLQAVCVSATKVSLIFLS